jgi:glycosyltransferase involved in cell wall biosynthesis
MRRVALVLPALRVGGAERQALELARMLPAHGWWPFFVLLEASGPLVAEARAAGFRVHGMRAHPELPKWSPAFWGDGLAVVRRMADTFRRERADAVHSLLFWSSQYAVPAARLAGVRAIVTCRLQMGDFKDRRPHYQLAENATNLLTHAVVANSLAVRRDALRRESLAPSRIVTIYNGVDAERLGASAPRDLRAEFPGLARATCIVAMVANLRRIKRHDVLLRALAEARCREPGLAALLLGAGEEERRLRGLAQRLRVADAVAFAGSVPDVAPYLAAAHVAALTSDGEGLPNSVMEAMAAGLPLVATRVGGIPELVRDGRTGILVARGDHRAVAKALVALARDPSLRARMGDAARRRIAAPWFRRESLAAQHARLWETVLRTGAPPPGPVLR